MAYKIALVGNPNCGKTTLFNYLTGSNQYVGNWPGVTVEKKEGKAKFGTIELSIVDLPGIYSLSPYSMEEVITRDYIVDEKPDVIINIIDGTNIERNLYLTTQLMELGVNLVVAVNMMDDVQAKGERIYAYRLARILGVPVVPIVARKGEHTSDLLKAVETAAEAGLASTKATALYDSATETAIAAIVAVLEGYPLTMPVRYLAIQLLQGQYPAQLRIKQQDINHIEEIAKSYEKQSTYGDRETMIADARYNFIATVVDQGVKKNRQIGHLTVSDRIDMVVTNRILALPIFLGIMLLMFSVVFGPLGQGLKNLSAHWISQFATWTSGFLATAGTAPWVHSLIVDAIIGGVGGILSFLPQIMLLFLGLSLLEDTGYMSRAAFIMDRLLRKLGLTGKSFIPMLMGFGCTTPAVMAARTMDNEKDRRLTIMLTPFMSCGAKLPIYGLFASVFFNRHQGLVVFAMYVTGMVVAILCGIALKHTIFRGGDAPFVMELPSYRLPTLKTTVLHLWDKCRGFLVKAGTIIFSMSVVIWLLRTFTPTLQVAGDSSSSIFAAIGMLLAPIFVPLGFGTWQAATSLLTGLIAKEMVVSTMGVLYGAGQVSLEAALTGVFTPLSALSFMVFCLLYTPCIAAFVAIRKEMNSTPWAVGTAIMQCTVAYFMALLVYQGGLLLGFI